MWAQSRCPSKWKGTKPESHVEADRGRAVLQRQGRLVEATMVFPLDFVSERIFEQTAKELVS